MRAEALLIAVVALGTVVASAQDGGSPHEMLTPEEEAEREMQRKRNAEPVLVCIPDELRASVRQGETVAVPIKISNAGGKMLRWAVTLAPQWLRLDSRSGELGFGEERALFVTFDATGLEQGPVKGTVVVEAEGAKGSPLTFRVDVTVAPALESPTDGDSPRQKTVKPAGPWALRFSRAQVDAGLMVRGAWLTPGGPDARLQFPATGVGIAASYETRFRSMLLQCALDWSQPQADAYDAAGGVWTDYELSYTSIGLRATFRAGERVRPSISAGYTLFAFERKNSWSGGSSLLVANGHGPCFGIGATYVLNQKLSLQAEYRWSLSDGEWQDDDLPQSPGAVEDRPTHLDLGFAVHF